MNGISSRPLDGVKYLIGINLLVYLAMFVFARYRLDNLLSLYNPMDERFRSYQLLTHMFIHSKNFIFHIFFNMLTLWMFGTQLEYLLGTRRFLTVYFSSGLLAAFSQILFNLGVSFYFFQVLDFSQAEFPLRGTLTGEQRVLVSSLYASMMGASGAVSGVVGGVARFFPDYKIFILPIPFPIAVRKALRLFVLGSVISAVFNLVPGVAHFAHIGGTIGGYFLGSYYVKNNFSGY
ncbi:MAG: rhomboid family intramembrane serine protease [Flavobacteriales bacterium]